MLHNPSLKNAAHKAWETRRLKAAGRAIVEAAKVAKTAPVVTSPLADARMVSMWMDNVEIGCGYRRFIVLDVGPRFVKLFSASKLATIEVLRSEFDRYAREVRGKAKTVTAIIKRNVAMADRINTEKLAIVVNDGGANAVKAIGRFA